MNKKKFEIIILLLVMCLPKLGQACTIFCGKDKQGQIWAANNEDNAFSFVNYINVFPKTEDTKYGYYTLSYFSEKNGENFNIHGGMNEAGLFYDFNSIPQTLIKDLNKKTKFPQGSQKILSHILANFETVQQVVNFFDEYWFDVGFNSAQMHVADKFGNFGIIGPSGSKTVKNEKYQLSTNFDICKNEDASSCWRYPIAKRELDRNEIGLQTFRDICEKTSQKGKDGNYTIYSNIQNLSTGEIWFYFISDYEHPFKTSLSELLSRGRKSYLIRNLFASHPVTQLYEDFIENGGQSAFEAYESLNLLAERKKEILSIFVNHFVGNEYNNSEAIPFLEEYLKYNPTGYWLRAERAIYYYQIGDKNKAEDIVKTYKLEVPETSMDVESLLNLFDGRFNKGSNVTITLNGHQDAKHVFVKGLPVPFDFLVKKDNKWIGKFKLGDGIYNYSFMVDGKKVFDSKTPVREVSSIFEDPFTTHQLCINMSNQTYLTTIKAIVPNKDDIVYIAGNQSSLTNWNSIFRLEKISDYERKITVPLHFPAKFKFTRGNWDSEAIIQGNHKNEDGQWIPLSINLDTNETTYQIVRWKDEK